MDILVKLWCTYYTKIYTRGTRLSTKKNFILYKIYKATCFFYFLFFCVSKNMTWNIFLSSLLCVVKKVFHVKGFYVRLAKLIATPRISNKHAISSRKHERERIQQEQLFGSCLSETNNNNNQKVILALRVSFLSLTPFLSNSLIHSYAW